MMFLHFSCSGNQPFRQKKGGGGDFKAAYQLPFLDPIEVGVLCIGYNLFYINAMCVELVLGVGGPRCKWSLDPLPFFSSFFVFVLVLVCVLRNVFMEGILNTPFTSNQILNVCENFIPLYYYVF